MTSKKIHKELINKSQKDIHELLQLIYDKKDSKNFLSNCFDYIARELDSTMIVNEITNVSFDFEDSLVINIVVNDSFDHKFVANSQHLDYVWACNRKLKRTSLGSI